MDKIKGENTMNKNLIAWYTFDDASNIGKDSSGNNCTAVAQGERAPKVEEICGRKAAHFFGGEHGVSYLELPKDILKDVNDNSGFTVSAWVCADRGTNVWERIIDFGKGQTGPYMFLTRFMRGVCFAGGDIAADAMKQCPVGEWQHIAWTITGTKGGSLSSAGPRVYINGELVADGFISQTSSGTYKAYRAWLETLEDLSNYDHNYIGRSQFGADADFCGSLSDFRLYSEALSENEIIGLMCEVLSDEQVLELAKNKFLTGPAQIITGDLSLAESLMEGRVQVKWSCNKPEVIAANGKVAAIRKPVGVTVTAELVCGESKVTKSFAATVLPKSVAPYEITIHGDQETIDISDTLYGLFYEDINNAADGGIYAEMINNRSFENFTFDTYDFRSGENGKSTGRNHDPLRFWFGDTDKVTVKNKGGLNEYFGLKDKDTNTCYVEVPAGAKLYNRGFCDNRLDYSMNLKEGVGYNFTIWAKPEQAASIKVALLDAEGNKVSNEVTIECKKAGQWKKYKAAKLVAEKTCMGQLVMEFEGNTAIDMVSLMPDDVWGAKKEKKSQSANANFKGNPNYRLRRDLVETLVELHPTFLRFPGGCISEGSYIWENVYDWKESVGDVEVRKENFNVWGYNMTMGLGYMEYFQLAEDLNAEPLPVMACGVLCQARSDYANPAGGRLQKKYIKNFTDLIDFAISTDFENNEWAALRKKMGHEAPFGLHYLGVGNENWGTEFFASFETFKTAIDKYMKKNYPGYPLTIISTAGAQADDTAYQEGWKFLAGYLKGGATVAFTDGEKSFTEDVTWYNKNKNYMDTIVDEHYYRSNEYLLENVDRYNYYYRSKKENQTSKVFVGEYASTDKNTLAGAVAEAAVMTGFEKNSDVVRLAATAPLFNKVVTDGTYRWTPDAIWFDNESVWRTPNYYVQQMFAKYIGKKLLETSFETYEQGEKTALAPRGGVVISAEGDVEFKSLKVTANKGKKVLFEQDFAVALAEGIAVLEKGARKGFYMNQPAWSNYTVEVTAVKKNEDAAIFVGAGLSASNPEKADLLEYCVGTKNGTGLKVYKSGVEGYTMGDYSSSVFAGNLRACYDEAVPAGREYVITVNYGGRDGKDITCFYTENGDKTKNGLLECKLEAYNREVFHSVTADENKVYTKLVNTENFDKKVLVKLDNLSVKNKAEVITLTGEAEFVHKPNVNTKEKEVVVPVTKKVSVKKDVLEIVLPANSVTVAVFERA
ncbi:MAG: alpha-L-arabinofuranosidase [Lachnospiraceae bacterium]|nr:alpha-L-arabinofuranosidase [Lachnospiraceae bacterium]